MTISAFSRLSFYSSQYVEKILKMWIKYLSGFERDDFLNFDNSKYGNLRENVNIFINKLKIVNVTAYIYRHTIKA